MYQTTIDLAGEVCFCPNFFQTRVRINYLIDEYLSDQTLGDLLADLTQQVLGELLQDEVNHLTKFWGMGMWLYPDGTEQLICYLLSQIHTILPVSCESTIKSPANIKPTFQRMMSILNWQSWSVLCRGELIYTFMWILKRMCHWSCQLTPEYLHLCCATPDFFWEQ